MWIIACCTALALAACSNNNGAGDASASAGAMNAGAGAAMMPGSAGMNGDTSNAGTGSGGATHAAFDAGAGTGGRPPDPNTDKDAGDQASDAAGNASDAHADAGGDAVDISMPGPFAVVSEAEGPDCTIWRPSELGADGTRRPVIIWGSGTAGPLFVYATAFEFWASHGFIVAGANVIDGQGDGIEMIACLDYLLAQDTTDGSVYEGKIDRDHVGASGHSQGGGGALMAGQDARVTTTAPLMPYIDQGFGGFDQACITRQHGPMLLLSGTDDTIAVPEFNQQPVFETTNVPVFWANLNGGDHVAVSLDGLETYRDVMLAWWRLQLFGDEHFRAMFYAADCTLCTDPAWQVMRKAIEP